MGVIKGVVERLVEEQVREVARREELEREREGGEKRMVFIAADDDHGDGVILTSIEDKSSSSSHAKASANTTPRAISNNGGSNDADLKTDRTVKGLQPIPNLCSDLSPNAGEEEGEAEDNDKGKDDSGRDSDSDKDKDTPADTIQRILSTDALAQDAFLTTHPEWKIGIEIESGYDYPPTASVYASEDQNGIGGGLGMRFLSASGASSAVGKREEEDDGASMHVLRDYKLDSLD